METVRVDELLPPAVTHMGLGSKLVFIPDGLDAASVTFPWKPLMEEALTLRVSTSPTFRVRDGVERLREKSGTMMVMVADRLRLELVPLISMV